MRRRREGEEKELSGRGGRGGGGRAAYDPPAVTTGGRERGLRAASYLLTSKYSRLSTAKQQGKAQSRVRVVSESHLNKRRPGQAGDNAPPHQPQQCEGQLQR